MTIGRLTPVMAGQPKVLLVSESAARRLWPNDDPIGKRMWAGQGSAGSGDASEVVGVVSDVRYRAIETAPAPDVYLEAAARLGVPPERCAAVEDSANGLRSAAAAGMWVVAVPNRRYPPPGELVQAADLVLTDLRELSPAAIKRLGSGG